MKIRRALERTATLALLLVALAVIWALTIQTPGETLGLSGWWSSLLASAGLVDAAQASFIVRKVVHTVEFLPVGILAALCAVVWLRNIFGRTSLIIGSVVFCAACSVADQIHKMYVPGREFDGRDLVFDAIGYLIGVTIVFVVQKRLEKRKQASLDAVVADE